MAKKKKAHLAGAYVVKAAESRPSRVEGKVRNQSSTPSSADKRLATTLLRAKHG